jgi:general secretion pathway protein I
LIEVVVALAVVAVVLASISSLVATSVRGTRAVDRHVALIETARAIMTGLPSGDELKPGTLSDELAGHRWRLDVLPFNANFVDPRNPTPYVPQTVVVRVQGLSGSAIEIDTVRLRRRPAP